MKTCKCHFFHWVIVIIGVVFLICAFIDMYFIAEFLRVKHVINFVILANSFFLLAIASKFMCGCWKNKDCNGTSESEKK